MQEKSILSFDYRKLEEGRKIWIEKRKYRSNIYNSIGKYIEYLEYLAKEEKDDYQKYLIEKQIKKLKREQDKYYDPCILAMKLPGKNYNEEKGKSLIKRIFNRK